VAPGSRAGDGCASGSRPGWQQLHRVVLDRLAQQELLDWSRAAVDSVSVRAKRRGQVTGPSPTDRGKAASKYHVLCDRNGLPLRASDRGAARARVPGADDGQTAPQRGPTPGGRVRCWFVHVGSWSAGVWWRRQGHRPVRPRGPAGEPGGLPTGGPTPDPATSGMSVSRIPRS